MGETIVRDSTINIPINVDEKIAKDFIAILVREEKQTELRFNEIRILLESILTELRRRKIKR